MVNKRKVRLMARTAMYEKHDGCNELKKAGYFKSDYVGAHMLLTGAAVTVGYFICILLVCIYRFEYIINNLTRLDYRQIMNNAIIIYVLLLIAYLVIAYFIYSVKYTNSQSGVRFYISRLKKIDKLNRLEKNELEKEGDGR